MSSQEVTGLQQVAGGRPVLLLLTSLVAAITLMPISKRWQLELTSPARGTSLFDAVLVVWVIGVLLVTLSPAFPAPGTAHVGLVPGSGTLFVISTGQGLEAVIEIAGNVLLFVPLGAILRLRGMSFRNSLLAASLLSAVVELAQFGFAVGRFTEIDDVILNTTGTAIGFLIAVGTEPPPRAS
jgi:glycopeptide antibiotics resistance protein